MVILNFAPGETWKFEIHAYSDKENPANYTVNIDKAE